jgi:glycine/D-amino acid oxidase-like deaminating enzyme
MNMQPTSANIVICGAGIIGVSAAYHLAKAGVTGILLVDERPPLSLTSDRSTECYRNWWPEPDMLALMARSIDILDALADESGNAFHMNRRGYLYVTADSAKIPTLRERLMRTSGLGAGPARIHTLADSAYQPTRPEGWRDEPPGADLLLGSELVRKHFPYLAEDTVAALHARRAGWLSAHELGMTLLEGARRLGVRFEAGRVNAVDVENGRVRAVRLGDGRRVESPVFVNAAGPYLKEVGTLLGLDIPVFTELHLKMMVRDPLGAVGRDAPLLIWDDEQSLPWEADERTALAEDASTRWLTEVFPAGAHLRPEGGEGSQVLVMLWEYKTRLAPPIEPPVMDEDFPEVTFRGLSRMVPRLREYFTKMPRPQMDGGYYTKTRDNKPLVGPLGVDGAFVVGAVSGYGIMSGCAVGELLAAHVTGAELPSYAEALSPARFDDLDYLKQLETQTESGQL